MTIAKNISNIAVQFAQVTLICVRDGTAGILGVGAGFATTVTMVSGVRSEYYEGLAQHSSMPWSLAVPATAICAAVGYTTGKHLVFKPVRNALGWVFRVPVKNND